MATDTHDVESALIESVCERVRERVAPEEVAEAEAFVRAYYRRAPAADLSGREPVDLYGAALAHWTFGRGREAGEARVRVYNPTFEQHGWQSPHTAIEIVSDDMPFLVDSVSMELSRRETGIHVLVHPVVGDESYMHIEVDRQADGLEELAEAMRTVLAQVRAAVEDWQPMRERMAALIDEERPTGVDVEEARALLAWVADHHFTFLGYREYELTESSLRAVEGSGLGLLRGGSGDSSGFAKLPLGVRALAREPDPLVLAKANTRSPVHRPAYLDYIGVKKFDDERNVIGERRFLGLYTTVRLPRGAGEHPGAAPEGDRGARARGLPARQPRRQGGRRDHRHLPARRALPDRGRRPLPGRHRRARAGRAPARAAVHAHRPLRALRVLPRVPAARSLQHGQPGQDRRAPARGGRGGDRRLGPAAERGRARPDPVHAAAPAGLAPVL